MIDLNKNRFIHIISSAIFLVLALGCTTTSSEYDDLASKATITALELENERLRNEREESQTLPEQATFTPQATSIPEQPAQEPENLSTEEQNSDISEEEDQVGNISIPDPAPPPPDNSLFFDDFSNNDKGWELGITEGGSISFTDNGLTITHSIDDKCIFATIPNFSAPDNYSIETTIYATNVYDGHFGFAFGGKTYGVGFSNGTYFIHIRDGQDSRNDREGAFWRGKTSFSLRMEVIRGDFSLFVNEERLSTTQFSLLEDDLALFSCKWQRSSISQQISFNNVLITE